MIEPIWQTYRDTDSLAEAVAQDVGATITEALATSESILIALPGGSTPLPVYEKLRQCDIDWPRVTIIPTDDRLVPPHSPLCNASMLHRIFAPLGAHIISLNGPAQDHHMAGHAADARLQQLVWPPALVWLGVGGDGHSASIFVGPDLEAALNAPATQRAIGVMPDPLPAEAPVARVSLTCAAISSARTLTIVVTGKAKRDLLENAIIDGPLSTLPIGRILAGTNMTIKIHWCP